MITALAFMILGAFLALVAVLVIANRNVEQIGPSEYRVHLFKQKQEPKLTSEEEVTYNDLKGNLSKLYRYRPELLSRIFDEVKSGNQGAVDNPANWDKLSESSEYTNFELGRLGLPPKLPDDWQVPDFDTWMKRYIKDNIKTPEEALAELDSYDKELDGDTDEPLTIYMYGEPKDSFTSIADMAQSMHVKSLIQIHRGLCDWLHFTDEITKRELIPEPFWYTDLVRTHDQIVQEIRKHIGDSDNLERS